MVLKHDAAVVLQLLLLAVFSSAAISDQADKGDNNAINNDSVIILVFFRKHSVHRYSLSDLEFFQFFFILDVGHPSPPQKNGFLSRYLKNGDF
jgi:hypothetical protein